MSWLYSKELKALDRKFRRIDTAAYLALRYNLPEEDFYHMAGLDRPVRWPTNEGSAHGRAVTLDG